MKRLIIFALYLTTLWVGVYGNPSSTPIIYIDSNGVMRWSDTRKEASFFGVNYTLPFAHAYRALGYLKLDRKAAIDKDVYHLSRLGFNAFRIHLWDVELTDGQGNLIENEHLDLMDYLIAKLKERNIHIVITAQTNFGNGYPERNQPTGGFSYQYDKCSIHSHPEAIAAQERYLTALVKHTNSYTGLAYKDDPSIVGFEINNEPCHAGTKDDVKAYINRMIKTIQKTGNRKPVFYNVSHNGYVVEAYYDTPIQGTTYQWYPIGLVSGQTQTGNFLPYVDRYDIPFDQVKGFNKKIRLVYEFDPADILYSYMYPAMARTFRTAGFQWITQFSYDPMDMAFANTEYQTHFLNLAYTPHKAISMKIAAEAAQSLPRGVSYGSYPKDTIFGDGFRVSYIHDLSELNNGTKYYYSNDTGTQPKNASQLVSIAGCGSSPIVTYEGTGAYFIDRLESGVWRLEVMPDAMVVNDPFAKPSLEKEVVTIAYGSWDMTLQIPDLGSEFTLTELSKESKADRVSRLKKEKENGLKEHNAKESTINKSHMNEHSMKDGIIPSLQPGVYLLKRANCVPAQNWNAESSWNNIRLGEYAAPASRATSYHIAHTPLSTIEAGRPLKISAQIIGPSIPDSVVIYTDKVSFWNEYNPTINMERIHGYKYEATIPATEIKEGCFKYNIVVYEGQGNRTYTFPAPTLADNSMYGYSAGIIGNPLDWNYTSNQYWSTNIVAPNSAITLLTVTDTYSGIEAYTLPEWNELERKLLNDSPIEKPLLRFSFTPKGTNPEHFLRSLVKGKIADRKEKVRVCTTLCIRVARDKELPEGLSAGFVTSDGYTYKSLCPTPSKEGIIRIPFDQLRQTDTALLPVAYPSFLKQYFHPETDIPFLPEKIEKLEISIKESKQPIIELGEVWLE